MRLQVHTTLTSNQRSSTSTQIFEKNFKELKSLLHAGTSGEQKGSVLFDFLSETLKTLLASGEDEQHLLDDFVRYLGHSDIKYFTIKSMLALVKERGKQPMTDEQRFSDNATKLLLAIKLPNGEKGRQQLAALTPLLLDGEFKLNYESASKLYADTWLLLLSSKVGPHSFCRRTICQTEFEPFLSLSCSLSFRSSRTRRSWPLWTRKFCLTSAALSPWPTS